jgi:hypothetical protein
MTKTVICCLMMMVCILMKCNKMCVMKLYFHFPAGVMRSRARTLPVGNQVPDRRNYKEGVRPAEDYVIKYLREQKKLKLVSLLEQKLSNAAAKEQRVLIEEGQHVLENHWTFWFDNSTKLTNSSCIWEKHSFEQTVAELALYFTGKMNINF